MASTGQESFFLREVHDGIIMDFCTRIHQNGSDQYEFNWYRMHFGKDFIEILKEYGQLPQASVKEA